MLAKQDEKLKSIADRIHTLYFIATPHRGAGSARLLQNIISISPLHSAKAYVADLIPNSGALQTINDQFRHVCQTLQFWSFFETVKTNLGKSQELIVEKDSAVLGNVSSLHSHTILTNLDSQTNTLHCLMQITDMS